jgi:hypothetical protein
MPKYDSISVKEYLKILESLPDKDREMLVIQFQCPRHEVSSRQLARLIGDRGQANIRYGRLGRRVCEKLHIAKPPGYWFKALSEAYWTGGWIWIMRENLAAAVKQMGWAREQSEVFFVSPEELPATEKFTEGKVQLVPVNIFERSVKARSACLRHYGFVCAVCEFDFEKIYGELGCEFIHVHHNKSLATIGKKYTVNPIKDLRPVCPNCHAMLHRRTPALTINQLKKLIKRTPRFRVSALRKHRETQIVHANGR